MTHRYGWSTNSSYDYIEWVENRREEAQQTGRLNPFDATMVAQITPGELNGVFHAHNYAQDLVVEWLTNHKFLDLGDHRNLREASYRRDEA